MTNKSIIIALLIVSLFLLPSGLIYSATGSAENKFDSASDHAAESGVIYKGTYTEYGDSAVPIVPVSELDMDDLNHNRLEDALEVDLTKTSNSELMEVIIRTEFFIDESFKSYLERAGAEIVYVIHGVESAGVRITKSNLLTLSKDPRIVRIYKNHQVIPQLSSAVPVVRADKNTLDNNEYSDIDGSGVTVTIIDTGADGSHRTFPAGKIVAFKDLWTGQDDLDPTNGMNAFDYNPQPHGTMTASCAAGTGGGTNYAGSAPGAYLVIIRVGGSSFDIAQAVQWSINNKDKDFNKDGTPDGPDLISMSLGTSPSSYIDNVCTNAVTNGIPFITSAGNSGPGSSTMTSPARAKDIIAVGGIHDNKNIWSSSSRGPGAGGITKPDVVAPGAPVTVAYPGNNWISTYGTSFSAPITAGVVALMMQLKPDLTPDEVMKVLHDTSEDRGTSGPDNAYGWGVVDAIAALDALPVIRKLLISDTDVEEDEEITFRADTSGKIMKFEWDFDGDGTFDYSSYTTPDTIYSYNKSGFYQATLKITDQKDKILTKQELVIVRNVKPELDVLYSGEYMNEDDVIMFNASGTYDTPTDKSKLVYFWDFNDGNTIETTETEIEHVYKHPGEYNVYVSVTDDDSETDTENIRIIISNILPVAKAGTDRERAEDEFIFFSAAESYDTPSDQPYLNYTWDMGDGSEVYKKEFYYVYSHSQKYTVALTVTDDNGAKDKEVVYITIRNVKPTVGIQEENLVVSEDELIKLHGIVNDTDSDVGSLELAWDFDDGNTLSWDSDNYVASHSFQNRGTYNVELKVKDDDGSVNKTTTEVRVLNVDPVAEFSMSANTIWEDEIVYFDAKDTTDTRSDLDNLEYYWDFGDQMTEMGKTVAHSFMYSGIFQVTLSVIDDDKAESKVSYYITVNNVKPEAIITTEVLEAYVGEDVNFSAEGSRDSKSDLERLIYEWEFEEGVTDSLKNTKYAFTKPGEYTVTLKVTDDNGDTSYSSVVMKIRSIPGSDSKSSVFLDLGETEGLLFLFMIIVIIVLVLMLLLFFMRQSSSRKKSGHAKGRGRGGHHGRHPSAALRAQHATYYMTNNQMGPQHQYSVADHHMMRPQPQPDLPPPWFRPSANEPQQQARQPMGTAQSGIGQAPQYPYPGFYPPQLPPQAAGPNGLQQNLDYNGQIPPVVEGEVVRTEELQLGGYPALPPSEEEAAPRPQGTEPKDELKPSVEVVEAAESEKSNGKKFCGTCGEPVQSSQWFICPSCKNVL